MNGVYCQYCGGPCDTGMNCIRGCKPTQTTFTTTSTVPPCEHEGWTFKAHGRRCHKCGKTLVDFGD